MHNVDLSVFNEVYNVIKDRKSNPVDGSYVCSILSHRKGINKVLEKVGEEAVETIIAVKDNQKEQIISESSDLLFHLFVMFVAADISLEEIVVEMKKRRK